MTTRPTLDTTPEDASLAKWTRDVEGFVENLIGNAKLPSAPAEVKVVSQSNSVKVTFRAVNEVGVSEYKVYRSTDKNFTGENAEHIATVTQAIDPASTDMVYIDAESTEKSYYFVSAVKGLRRPRLEGPVAGFGSATEGHEIGEGNAGGGIISGFSGIPGSILFVNEDSLIDQDNDNFFYSQSFKAMVVGKAGLTWGPHSSPDVFLVREDPDVLAMKRGSNSQEFRLYEQKVSGADVFLSVKALGVSNRFEVLVDDGAGTTRDLAVGTRALGGELILVTDGVTAVTIGTDQSVILAGTLEVTDNTTLQGTLIIDVTNIEALLVRTDSDGADVFHVNTTAPEVTVFGHFDVQGVADDLQVHVTGFSTQTNSILLIEKNDLTELLTVDNRGDLNLASYDIGNDVSGRLVHIHNNTNVAVGTAGPAPGILRLEPATGGVTGYFWVGDDGDLRTHNAAATGNNSNATVDANEDGFKLQIHESVHFSFRSKPGSSGVNYLGGFYDGPSTDASLNQGSPTVTVGSANHPYAAHAFIVAGAAGAATGGSGLVEIEVSGTSITDAGTRTTSDTEVIVADITALATDDYAETAKKWIGQVTYTLQLAGGATHTAFNVDFNYGLAKYNDIGNHDFQLQAFDAIGRAGGNDSNFDLEILHHQATGWTYAASGFIPGSAPISQLTTIYGTESDLANGEPFAFKQTGLSEIIRGEGSEGFLVRVTTGTNNAVEFLDFGITIALI